MKLRVVSGCALILLAAFQVAVALPKPNFSGVWVLDKNRSFSNAPGLEQTLTITHNGDQISLESKQKTGQGERVINETYTLNGQTGDFTPASASPGAKGKRKASWLPNARGIVIEDEITTDSPNGPVVQKVMRKWSLSADGNTLTVDYYFDDQRGSFEAKRVFAKK